MVCGASDCDRVVEGSISDEGRVLLGRAPRPFLILFADIESINAPADQSSAIRGPFGCSSADRPPGPSPGHPASYLANHPSGHLAGHSAGHPEGCSLAVGEEGGV